MFLISTIWKLSRHKSTRQKLKWALFLLNIHWYIEKFDDKILFFKCWNVHSHSLMFSGKKSRNIQAQRQKLEHVFYTIQLSGKNNEWESFLELGMSKLGTDVRSTDRSWTGSPSFLQKVTKTFDLVGAMMH